MLPTSCPPAPVVILAYNRPHHLRQTLESLQRSAYAAATDLYIYSDGAKDASMATLVAEVRAVAHAAQGWKRVTVVEQPHNCGLAANVIAGVSRVVKEYGRVIVVEDDLICAPSFLPFMNSALELYKDDERVGNINGCVLDTRKRLPDTFFIHFINSTGWGTWERAWNLFNPDGQALLSEIERRGLSHAFDFDGGYPFTRMLRRQIAGITNSWAIRWKASMLLQGKLSLNVGRSLITNIGFDGTGINSNNASMYVSTLYMGELRPDPLLPVEENLFARRQIRQVYAWESNKIIKGVRKAEELYRRAKSRLTQL